MHTLVDENLLLCKAAGSSYYATTDGTTQSVVAKDTYNIILNYYNNDYKGTDFSSLRDDNAGQELRGWK